MAINGAQLHLLVNHLPVVGFLGMVLALIVALFFKSYEIKRFVLAATVLVGFSGLASYWTGEPAEDVAERLPGVTKELIHDHEEAAEFATVLSVVTAVAAAAALIWHQRRPESLRASVPLVLLLALLTAATMAKTAHEGGKIRHSEIR